MGSFSVSHWIIFGVIVWFCFKLFGSKPKPRSTLDQEKNTPLLQQKHTAKFQWPALNEYDFEVVGESFYQEQLERMAGGHGLDSANVHKIAYLVPESNNPHDDKAVRVDIDGYTVGHLSRDDARSFRRRLSSKKMSSETTSCHALIMGGHTNPQGEKMHYGVRLDLKPFF
jgi:hypothetical protein